MSVVGVGADEGVEVLALLGAGEKLLRELAGLLLASRDVLSRHLSGEGDQDVLQPDAGGGGGRGCRRSSRCRRRLRGRRRGGRGRGRGLTGECRDQDDEDGDERRDETVLSQTTPPPAILFARAQYEN